MKKTRQRCCMAIALSAVMLCGCGEISIGSAPAETTDSIAVPAENEAADISSALNSIDKAINDGASYNGETEATADIVFGNDGATVSGENVKADGTVVTISAGGVYSISGSTLNGQLVIDAGKEDVTLLLDGAEIACENSSAIYSKAAGTTTVVVTDKTENILTDGSAYVYSSADEDEPDAALFSKNDMIICGNGTLTVNGRYKNGIGTKDNLVISCGQVYVNAVNDGIKGRDSVLISGGEITVASGADGIQASNDEDEALGWVSVTGGKIKISSSLDGIQAQTVLKITGGDVDVSTSSLSGDSAKGLKAGSAVVIDGGTLDISSTDDAVHSNGDVTVGGGTLTLSSGDDGIHADASLIIENGSIDIVKSYEGLEAAAITINGGKINAASSDDGFNAAGGNDSSQEKGRMGGDMFAADMSCFIKITGGEVYVNADGDGIDSNGTLYISGGSVVVDGPVNDGNGALDFGGECVISGGTVVAAGSSGMAQAPSASSAQYSVMMTFDETLSPETTIEISDSNGNVILSCSPKKSFRTVLFSADSLENGKEYSVSCGGEKYDSFTVSSSVTYVGNAPNGFGGMGKGFPGDIPQGDAPQKHGDFPGGKQPPTEKNPMA